MNNWALMLKLVANELGVTPIERKDDDLDAFEAAIYMAQIQGMDLGYSFTCVGGLPHSPRLMQEFESLFAIETSKGDEAQLRPGIKEQISNIRDQLALPQEVSSKDWLQALAAVSIMDNPIDCEAELTKYKPELLPLIGRLRAKSGGVLA